MQFIPSGCTLLDKVLGGGWPLGRMSNLVGDKSTGKTLLAIEACANFNILHPKGKIWYREAEAAFDVGYAEAVGLPARAVDFGPNGPDSKWDTVEDIFEDLERCLSVVEKSGKPGLYIVDSLDALTSRASLARNVGEGTYNLEKQKILGEMFSELSRRIKSTRVALLVISQVRARIGITFGEKYRRSGGSALDFYASQIVWLSHLKTLVRKVRGSKRATGVRIRAKCKKNKVVAPFRECDFTIRFGYGVDDLTANVEYLQEVKRLSLAGIKPANVDDYLDEAEELPDDELHERQAMVKLAVQQAWEEIEEDVRPKRRKYG